VNCNENGFSSHFTGRLKGHGDVAETATLQAPEMCAVE
jgi:hypothetical protein